jgi:ABC-type dipeptide/oligopeptide/nickel transport system permease subunit
MSNTSAIVGALLLGAWIAIALLAPLIVPYDPTDTVNLARRPPTAEHWFGTDLLGRDVFSRVLVGSQHLAAARLISVALGALPGIALGLVAGYYGGLIDTLVSRFVDAMLAFPSILLALVVIAALGPSIQNVMIAVGVVTVPQYARLVRGSVLAVKQLPYVEAARVIGAPSLRIMWRHVLANAYAPVLVLSTLQVGNAILVGSGLSFLGLGAQPPIPEWGLMSAEGREVLQPRLVDLDLPGPRDPQRGDRLQPAGRRPALGLRSQDAGGVVTQPFVGIQISPISFIDEGVDTVLDTLQQRFGVTVLMIGTVSWLGLKVGRRISHALEGFPDHGVPAPYAMKGGAYIHTRPQYYADTAIKAFRSTDPELAGRDILEMVIGPARKRGLRVMPEFMEPLFKYAGHGATSDVSVPGLAACMEVDLDGRTTEEPCTNNPDYRLWWHGMIEEHASEYAIDGIMWCNERNSPLDRMMQGQAPGCFCPIADREAADRGIDVGASRAAFQPVWRFFQQARAGESFVDGTFVEFLRVLLRHPEVLIWERFWLERSKDLDRELHGDREEARSESRVRAERLEPQPLQPRAQGAMGLARADRLLRLGEADHLPAPGRRHPRSRRWSISRADILKDFALQEFVPAMYRILGLDEAPIDSVIQAGMDPDTYVAGQCADAVRGVAGQGRSTWASASTRRARAPTRRSARPTSSVAACTRPIARRAGRGLFAQLCRHESGHARWRGTGARGTRAQAQGEGMMTDMQPRLLRSLAKRIHEEDVSYRTRLMERAAKLQDVIAMGRGDPDFHTPRHIVEAAKKAIDEQRAPLHVAGRHAALREAIAASRSDFGLDYAADEVVVTAGAQEAVMLCMLALVEFRRRGPDADGRASPPTTRRWRCAAASPSRCRPWRRTISRWCPAEIEKRITPRTKRDGAGHAQQPDRRRDAA